MPDEHESAIAAWLDSVSTRRELTILGDRFPHWTEYERYSFALQMEMLVALDTYELPDGDGQRRAGADRGGGDRQGRR
jgi:hypothetical protein